MERTLTEITVYLVAFVIMTTEKFFGVMSYTQNKLLFSTVKKNKVKSISRHFFSIKY